MKYDLSILIPARNEQFLAKTVECILSKKRGNTEVIVGLDGQWSNPPLVDHPNLTILYFAESIGQRAMTNQCARLSKAKYVMKIDAHCDVDEGFDVKMMEHMKDNYTMIPTLYNLHAFDWVCKGGGNKKDCGHKIYQGPTPTECPECHGKMEREVLWQPRWNRKSEFYKFDTDLHFQYEGSRKKIAPKDDILVETMSAQGSCFMLTREKYWELNMSDEAHGSWGQQGTEIACKTWLSGGRLVTNRATWYSHLFRTQGGDFGFPYPQSGKQVEAARQYSRKLFLENTWEKQIYPLSWLIQKFAPLTSGSKRDGAPDWHDEAGKEKLEYVNKKGEEFEEDQKGPTKGIIYYTNNKVNLKLGHKCRKQILKAGLPIVSVSHKPMDFGDNYVYKGESGYLAYHEQILLALQKSTADIVYFCEHDVLYDTSHFAFTPLRKDTYYYDFNFWRVRASDNFAIHYDTHQVNLICGYRSLLLTHYKEKVDRIRASGFTMRMGFEPGANKRRERIDDHPAVSYLASRPSLDIRHDTNLTRSRWSKSEFRDQRNCRGWKEVLDIRTITHLF